MAEHVRVIGDVIHYNGDAVARIGVPTGTVRDRFTKAIEQEENVEVQKKFAADIRKLAVEKAQANTITLIELDDIFDALLEA